MEIPFIKESRGFAREFADSIVAGVSLTILAVAVISLNFVQMSSLLIFPFSKGAFRKLNLACAYVFWKLCVIFIEKIYRVEMVITGDPTPYGESVILFCNHQQQPDILALMPLADRNGRVANLKWFAKDVIKYVPGVGWGMLFLDCIFLKRDWTADAARIRGTFSNLLGSKLPYWLISFSEGTRITESKLKRSQEFSRRNGLKILNHVLTPRTKGFVASVNALREDADAVYDVTIGYEPGIPTLWQFLKGRLRKIHLHVRRFPLQALPREEKELSNWLVERFIEKDALLGKFIATGRLD